MEGTHHRTGAKALLTDNVSKAPELSNPMDLNSTPTGNTCFIGPLESRSLDRNSIFVCLRR